ncbi:hypothetical protein [Sediminibacterium sp.]|uniref:hypothetical protein n=1 Tax=Sediminibacterium sp. TaxID=1917865 RepID=UPI003F69B23F
MNTHNIAVLSAMLIRAGFEEGIGYRLLQRISFTPAAFILIEKLQKNKDLLTCQLYFERNGTEYACGYYDVSLIKGIVMPERSLNNINLAELDLAMDVIDWQFKADSESFRLDDELTWKREKEIAEAVNQLARLSATQDGKHFADALKLKYWLGSGLEELVGNLNAIRAKFEISQRVYFIEGEGISVDEAYRFLLNRWMEKKMQAKRREKGKEALNDKTEPQGEGLSKGLLLKKRRSKSRRIKQ